MSIRGALHRAFIHGVGRGMKRQGKGVVRAYSRLGAVESRGEVACPERRLDVVAC